jgi:ACT domain-containing protein
MARVSKMEIIEAKKLLDKNPDMTRQEFMKNTGLSSATYYRLKSKTFDEVANPQLSYVFNNETIEELEKRMLKLKLKRKLESELKQVLNNAGYLNAKSTFLRS